jgi:hypothetical protein
MARRSPDALISVTTGPEWKRVDRALRAVDERLSYEFRAELRDAADVLARRAQHEVMNIPTYTANHSGLRARVAKGVGVKMAAGGVNITASMNYKDERNLPAYLDAQSGWRHPVFGNRSVWVSQETGGSWFRETIASGDDMIGNRFEDIFERAVRTIAAAGA